MTSQEKPAANSPEDIEIHAFSDSELPTGAADLVAARLRRDADARVLALALKIQRDALAATYPLPLNCPVTQQMTEQFLAGIARSRP